MDDAEVDAVIFGMELEFANSDDRHRMIRDKLREIRDRRIAMEAGEADS